MVTFLSWSGERSKIVAECLRGWLPHVINALEPWMSAEDVETGSRWSVEIGNKLDETDFGIICLTGENTSAPWILFESGALSKAVERSRVCPYLFGLKPRDIKGPLVQFQSTAADKPGTFKLLKSLNEAVEKGKLTSPSLEEAFEVWWPKLEEKLARVPGPNAKLPPQRSDREVLDEILELARQNARQPSPEDTDAADLTRPSSELVAASKREAIMDAYSQANGDYKGAARTLGLHPNYLLRLVRNLGLQDDVRKLRE